MYSFILLSLVVMVYCQPQPEQYNDEHYKAKVQKLDEVEDLINKVTTRIQNLKDKMALRQKQKEDANRKAKNMLLRLDRMNLKGDDGSFHCPEKHFKCSSGNECVNNILVCDNAKDCEDGSDEHPDLCSHWKSDHGHWGYEDTAHWGTSHSICGKGRAQSPINLEEDYMLHMSSSPDPKIFGDGSHPGNFPYVLTNNGHAVQLNFPSGKYSLYGLGIKGKYVIDQLHFHWGAEEKKGSEHTVDGEMFPIEMHIVSHRDDWDSLGDAVHSNYPSALAVLGFFFELSDDGADNEFLSPITKELHHLHSTGSAAAVEDFDLEGLISEAFKKPYMRYHGSLTTPPCSEVVVWTIFNRELHLSSHQLDAFRNTGITDNYRPAQPLYGRSVYMMH